MIPVTRIVKTYRTTVTLVRKGKRTTISYTLQKLLTLVLNRVKTQLPVLMLKVKIIGINTLVLL